MARLVDDDGLEGFYREHADAVRKALCLALGDVDLGTEAADEAMARACAHWQAVGQFDNAVGWAYRVGLNWARSHQRRLRWLARGAVPDRAIVAVPGDADLSRALARLSIEHRTVIVCRFYLDWSVEETAQALGVAEGTVKGRLGRALRILHRRLENHR